MLENPTVRALIRDILAGLGAFVASLQAADNYGGETWMAAAIAGVALFVVLAGAEFGTPLNPSVGLGKGEEVSFTFADVCLAVIAVCSVVALFAGWDAF